MKTYYTICYVDGWTKEQKTMSGYFADDATVIFYANFEGYPISIMRDGIEIYKHKPLSGRE